MNRTRLRLLHGLGQDDQNLRDPLSHLTESDFDDDDARMMLISARKILDFLQLPEPARRILEIRDQLGGGIEDSTHGGLIHLPPEEEVVRDFIGRGTELNILKDWLLNPSRKRWVLSGEGGKGKSAIAYKFGRLAAAMPDVQLDAIIWISAKRRRFIEGAGATDRPSRFFRP